MNICLCILYTYVSVCVLFLLQERRKWIWGTLTEMNILGFWGRDTQVGILLIYQVLNKVLSHPVLPQSAFMPRFMRPLLYEVTTSCLGFTVMKTITRYFWIAY